MATPIGTFDHQMLPIGWFDESAQVEGWFDGDLLGAAPTSSSDTAGPQGSSCSGSWVAVTRVTED